MVKNEHSQYNTNCHHSAGMKLDIQHFLCWGFGRLQSLCKRSSTTTNIDRQPFVAVELSVMPQAGERVDLPASTTRYTNSYSDAIMKAKQVHKILPTSPNQTHHSPQNRF